MTRTSTRLPLAAWDHTYLWHPFTQMQEWEAETPLIIEKGQGSYLIDTEGRKYLDGTSSIWVNLHGHRHPHLDRALTAQLRRIAHSTFLGLSNPPAIRLGARMARSTYQYTLQGSDLELLYTGARALEKKMRQLPALTDVSTDLLVSNPQASVMLDRDRARLGGGLRMAIS